MTTAQRLRRTDDLATRVETVIDELRSMERAGAKSRHLSLAATKLEEARHRLADEMAELSDSTTTTSNQRSTGN